MATEVGNIHIGLYVDVGDTARFNDVASMVETSSRRMNSALGNTTNSVKSLRGQMSQSLRFKLASDSLRDITKASDEVGRLRAAILGVSALSGAGITGAFTSAYLVQTADKSKLLGNQIRTVTNDFAEYGAIQDRLYDIAQRTRSSLETTVQLYARNSRAAEKYGMSQEKLLTITETIQKSFAIGGATPQEAAGAALQLSQGIASDKFGGDEFRSVSENAPVLLQAMAKALNTDIGGLRKMSTEGKLTAKTVTEAILKSTSDINAAYAKMVPTVAQAFTTLDNAFLRYVGQTDAAYGVTDKLSGALMGIANNFEEVFGWITKATAAIALFYAANKIQKSGAGAIVDVKSTNKQIRESISDMVDQRDAIKKQLDLTNSKIADRQFQSTTSSSFDPGVLAAQDAINKAKEKQYVSEQRVAELEKARSDLMAKLGSSQSAASVLAQSEVEKARERVRLDQQRVIEAQMAAAAEERILIARKEQSLIKSGAKVTAATDKVATSSARVNEAEAVIAKERELAKVKLANEIDARRQTLVTSTQKLNSVREQLSELRSVKDLADFDKVFGSQYKSLLEQQQKAIASTKSTRDKIVSLQSEMASINSGEATTGGISSAMNKHASAVKQAQSAVEALAKAQSEYQKIASADVGSKTLQSRIDAEQKAIKQYEASIGVLSQKMGALKTSTTDALGSGSAKKLVSEIEKVESRILAAQQSLRSATDAVNQAQSGSSSSIATSLKAQSKAQEEINKLQQDAVVLAESHAVSVQKIAEAQKRLNVLRRAGSSVLDYFGGVTGLGITVALTAATAAMSYFAAEGAKSAQRTASLREEMYGLGLISKETAGKIDSASESIDNLTDEKRRKKIKELKAEIEKTKSSTGFWEGLFSGDDQESLGDLSNKVDAVIKRLTGRIRTSDAERNDLPIARQLKELIKEAESGTKPMDEIMKSLDAIAKQPLSDKMNEMVISARTLFDVLKGTQAYMDRINRGMDTQPSGQDMMARYQNSRTESANRMAVYGSRVEGLEGKTLYDSSKTEYETQISSIMDKLIADAKKMGETLLDADARRIAEAEYANQKAKSGLLDLIGTFEGTDKGRGYNETLDYGAYTGGDVNLTMMTLKEVLELQKKMLADPNNTKNSSAVGRYQITSQTLRDFMGQLGLSSDTIFDKATQDRIAQAIIRSTGGDADKLRGRWAGLNKASDSQIKMASDGTFKDLPAFDENTKKWLDGIKDLDLQKQISSLSSFNQEVVKQASSLGASKDEVQQYIDAISSGKLDAIPDKFRKIAEALKLSDGAFARQMNELKQADVVGLMSDIDQNVISTAKSWGISEEQIRAYIKAVRDGNLSEMPSQLSAIREELQRTADIKFDKELLGSALDDMRTALKDGKLSWQELGDVALNVLNKIVDKLQDKMIDSLFSSASTTSSVSSGGGLFAGIAKIFGFADGGYTGDGGKNEPKGTVHGGEFVLTKKATQRAGIGNLYSLMSYLETGSLKSMMPANSNMPGYADGGYVGSFSAPSLPSIQDSGLSEMAGNVQNSTPASAAPSSLEVNVSGARGNSEIMDMVKSGVHQGLKAYDRVLPYRIKEVNKNPNKVK